MTFCSNVYTTVYANDKTNADIRKEAARIEEYFQGCLYFSTSRLFRAGPLDSLASESFGPLGLAASHAFLLMVLGESPKKSSTPSQLASVMNLDRSTVTRLLAPLERSGLVRRVRSGRTVLAELLPAGRSPLPDIRAAWKDLYRRYCQIFGAERANALNRSVAALNREFKS